MSENKPLDSYSLNPGIPSHLDTAPVLPKPRLGFDFWRRDESQASVENTSAVAQAEKLYEKLQQLVEIEVELNRAIPKAERQRKWQQRGEQGKVNADTLQAERLRERQQAQAASVPTAVERAKLIREGKLHLALAGLTFQEGVSPERQAAQQKMIPLEKEIRSLLEEPGVKEAYKKLRAHKLLVQRQAARAQSYKQAAQGLELQEERIQRQAFLEGGRAFQPGEEAFLAQVREVKKQLEDAEKSLLTDTEVFDAHRLRSLQEYRRELSSDGFVRTPTRLNYLSRLRQFLAEGKKVLMTGATGTGKTELGLHASRELFGVEANRLTGHTLMTNYEIYGKMAGKNVDGQVVVGFDPGPLTRAVDEDTPLVIDEVNLIPNKVFMRLKTDLNARVGQEITIQEENGVKHRVGERYAVIATANVKSEKHPEREELDDAIVRMFEPMKIGYFPPHELYDIMLASLLDVKGGINSSPKDVAETLPDLCDAAEWIQQSYLGEPPSDLEPRATGQKVTLRKAVLDPGRAVGMLSGWESSRQAGLTLREHINKKLVAFIQNENYPEEDRYYLVKILSLKGFLKGVDAKILGVSNLDQAVLDRWNGYDGKRYVSKTQYIEPDFVAKLDPYGKLARPQDDELDDLLDLDEIDENVVLEESSAVGGPSRRESLKPKEIKNINTQEIQDLEGYISGLRTGNEAISAITQYSKILERDPSLAEQVLQSIGRIVESQPAFFTDWGTTDINIVVSALETVHEAVKSGTHISVVTLSKVTGPFKILQRIYENQGLSYFQSKLKDQLDNINLDFK